MLTKASGQIGVTLNLHNVETDSVVQASASQPLGASTAGSVALEAVRELLPKWVDPERRVDLSLISERAPAAIANWMQGERSYRLSRFANALGFYQRALEPNSLIVFAALKGAQAANWSHKPDQAKQLNAARARFEAGAPCAVPSISRGITGLPDRLAGHCARAFQQRAASQRELERGLNAAG